MLHVDAVRSGGEDRVDGKTALIAIVVLAALFAFLFFGPRNDPAKVVAGIPCSVLSEDAIGAVLETPVRLMPTNGTTCEYVPTQARVQRTVFVIAHREAISPTAFAADKTVRFRSGSHWYSIVVVPANPNGSGHDDELRLARRMSLTTAVAQNR